MYHQSLEADQVPLSKGSSESFLSRSQGLPQDHGKEGQGTETEGSQAAKDAQADGTQGTMPEASSESSAWAQALYQAREAVTHSQWRRIDR